MPPGRGGRDRGRGRGVASVGPGMRRGDMNRPDPRLIMTFRAFRDRSDPRQWPTEGLCSRPDSRRMTHCRGIMPSLSDPAVLRSFRGRRCGGPLRSCHALQQAQESEVGSEIALRESDNGGKDHKDLAKQDTVGAKGRTGRRRCASSGALWYAYRERLPKVEHIDRRSRVSGGNLSQTSGDEDNRAMTCNKEKLTKKGCRRVWRQFMRRRLHECTTKPSPPGGPHLPGPFMWGSPMQGTGHRRMPSTMLHRLRRLLAVLETEIGQQGVSENSKSETNQGPRRARLQARLRRLIEHIERQKDGIDGISTTHGRYSHKRSQRVQKSQACEKTRLSNEAVRSSDDGAKDADDCAMSTKRRGPLEDWRAFQEDVEQLQIAEERSTTPSHEDESNERS